MVVDCRDGLMLDLYAGRYAEVRSWCEEKIARCEIYPCSFVIVISPVSPNVWKIDYVGDRGARVGSFRSDL